MLSKTRGIVLHTIRYNDTYNIVHLYTEAFGRTACRVAHRRGGKTKTPPALFMPLSVIDLEMDYQPAKEIQRLYEARVCYPLHDIGRHPVKNGIVLFLSEILYRVARAKEADPHLFHYLFNAIHWLETAEQGVANFHLVFLMHLVRYLGVYPNTESYRPDCFFDLLNGAFTAHPPEHSHYLSRDESIVFARLLRMNYGNMALYAFSHTERQNIIRRMLEYYRLHLSDFPEIKSLAVMQQLFA
jgi:DNA repair protein RecO (recombination protein O)